MTGWASGASLNIFLVGTDLLEGDVTDSAMSWAANAANTNTDCTDIDSCEWWFDGYVLYVEYSDSAASVTSATDNLYFCLQIMDRNLEAENYECGDRFSQFYRAISTVDFLEVTETLNIAVDFD